MAGGSGSADVLKLLHIMVTLVYEHFSDYSSTIVAFSLKSFSAENKNKNYFYEKMKTYLK